VTEPAYLTPKEVAELLRRSVKSFYRMLGEDSTFPRLKLPGGGILVPRQALERWLHDHTEGTRGPLPRVVSTPTCESPSTHSRAGALNGA
jgi:excisionase family DNA binding protein